MGAFFANVQVQARYGSEDEVHALVMAQLREQARKKGLRDAPEGTEATRTVIVGPPGPWIAVYDDAAEGDPTEVAALARSLSRATDWRALAALVHDSSQLFVFLYEAGKKLDEVGGGKKGNVERWRGLVDPAHLPALRSALHAENLFAEDTLRSIATLIGIDEEAISTGCGYLHREGHKPDGATTLRFSLIEALEHERPATGPSRFTARSWNSRSLSAVGGKLHLAAAVHNAGGPSVGVSLILHGPAVEESLIEPQEAVLSSQASRTDPHPFERRMLNNGRAGYVADFPSYAIPPAIGREFSRPDGVSLEDWMRKLQRDGVNLSRNQTRSMTSDIHGSVTVRALRVGTAPVYMSFVPLEAREGQFHFGQEVAIIAPPRAPLRAASDHAESLADLEAPHVLVAFAASTLELAEAAPVAANAIEKWGESWSDGGLTSATFFRFDGPPRRKPKELHLQAKGFATGRAWRDLRAAMATEREVTVRGGPRQSSLRPGDLIQDGFRFGVGLQLAARTEDSDLPTLQLTIDLRDRRDAEALLQMARSVMNEFVVRAKCAQAFVARWGSAGSLDTTPYERVCGVSGQCTLRRTWQTRFLRAVSAEGLWLGSKLLQRIDRTALDVVALTDRVGDTLRILLREGSTIDELERVLAPVLPSPEDWRNGVAWAYGRRDTPPG